MTITQGELRDAAGRRRTEGSRSLNEARAAGRRTAFLCHSHADRELVFGTIKLLREGGWNVYVDWADATMPAVPDETTAARIKERIVVSDWFLFLATANSTASRWCPWEIGYADGRKPIERILIIPTSDGGYTYGSEYLGLYRRIDWAADAQLAAFPPRGQGTYVQYL